MHCTGLTGQPCTCGHWHTAYHYEDDDCGPGLLSSPTFYSLGAVCIAFLGFIGWWLT